MRHYVVGFIFDGSREQVVMVEKKRPAWQAGLMNGTGGAVKPGERHRDAISRETLEEAGVRVDPEAWRLLAVQQWDGGQCHYYDVADTDALLAAKTQQNSNWGSDRPDEEVGRIAVEYCLEGVVPNVSWLLQLAVNADNGKTQVQLPVFFTERYVGD